MLEISTIEGEAGNQEPGPLKGTRNHLPHQKPPRVIAIAKRESEHIWEVREPPKVDMGDILGDCDAVVDVLAPEPAVEARDAAGIVELDEMMRNIARAFQREHCPGRGSGGDPNRLAAGKR